MLLDGLFSNSSPNQTILGFTPDEMGLLGYSIMNGGGMNPAMALALMGDQPQQAQQGRQPQQPLNPFNPFPMPGSAPAQNQASLNQIQPNQGQTPPANIVDRIMNAIGKVESSGNYGAMGPATRSGDRAYGRYQVMGNNIPSWSKEALGYSVTPDEFISNPELQDKIANYKLTQYHTKYGNPQDVASMWFSGRPTRNNVSKDVLGTSVPDYVSRVMKHI